MSNLFLRLRGRDVPIASLKVKIKQNSIGDISIVVPFAPLVNGGESYEDALQAVRLLEVFVYHNGKLLRNGYIKDLRPVDFNRVPGFVEMNCEDALGLLSNVWSYPRAQYQANFAEDALADLLRLAPDWIINDTRTYSQVAVAMNVTDRESLWSQIASLAEQVTGQYVRYGGYNIPTQQHMIDLGAFNTERSPVFAIQGVNLISIENERNPFKKIKKLRPLGGDLDSGDQLELNGGETPVTGFPILLDTITNKYYIENTALNAGIELVETFDEVEPRASPTVGQLAEARQALYNRALREMQNGAGVDIITVECVLHELPNIGDAILVVSELEEKIEDVFLGIDSYRPVRQYNDLFRISEIQVDFRDGISPQLPDDLLALANEGLVCKITATNAQDVPNYNAVRKLARKVRRRRIKNSTPQIRNTPQTITVTHTNAMSDVQSATGYKGKLFTFTPAAAPAGTNYIRWRITETSINSVKWEVLTVPVVSLDPLVLVLSGPSGQDWDSSIYLKVSVQFMFYQY